MPLITVQLDDATHRELVSHAAAADQTVETFAVQLLHEWLTFPVPPAQAKLETRKARGTPDGLRAFLAKAPDAPPVPGDEFP